MGVDPAAVGKLLAERGVEPPARVVDAGCGTGRHVRALASLGYRAVGVDRSAELIAQARRLGADAELVVGDLLTWRPKVPAAAVLCRGVLNDLTGAAERAAALPALAAMLARGGVLVADVREWERSAERYADGRRLERRGTTARGEVVLRSEMRADGARRELVADELIEAGGVEYRCEFRMKPWTRAELHGALDEARLGDVEELEPAVAGARDDRIVFVARRT